MELNTVILKKFGWLDHGGWSVINKHTTEVNDLSFDAKTYYSGWSFEDDLSGSSLLGFEYRNTYLLFAVCDKVKNDKTKKIIAYKLASIKRNDKGEKIVEIIEIKTNSELFRYIIDNKAFCKEYKRNYEILNILK